MPTAPWWHLAVLRALMLRTGGVVIRRTAGVLAAQTDGDGLGGDLDVTI
jgi:hypothetical protein